MGPVRVFNYFSCKCGHGCGIIAPCALPINKDKINLKRDSVSLATAEGLGFCTSHGTHKGQKGDRNQRQTVFVQLETITVFIKGRVLDVEPVRKE